MMSELYVKCVFIFVIVYCYVTLPRKLSRLIEFTQSSTMVNYIQFLIINISIITPKNKLSSNATLSINFFLIELQIEKRYCTFVNAVIR